MHEGLNTPRKEVGKMRKAIFVAACLLLFGCGNAGNTNHENGLCDVCVSSDACQVGLFCQANPQDPSNYGYCSARTGEKCQ